MCRIVSNLRALLRVLGLVLLVLSSVWIVVIVHLLKCDRLRAIMVRWFYVACCRICGIRTIIEGRFSTVRPLLVVSNHTTYLDIITLGSLVPLAFTPKREIRSWPLIGFLAVLADCVFIERRPSHMQAAAEEMRTKLKRGKVLCIFGEGTTTDGINIKPFKSGFFNLAIEENLAVQPVSLAYTHFGARPIARDHREELAWVGEATLIDHFWHILSMPSVRVHVRIHPAIPAGTYDHRKPLTLACEQAVKTGVAELMGNYGVV